MATILNPVQRVEGQTPVKPPSAKKEFENLIRDIRTIFAKARWECGFLTDEVLRQTQSSATKQKIWTYAGSVPQLFAIGAAVYGYRTGGKGFESAAQALNVVSKGTDTWQGICNLAQTDHGAEQQRSQQATTQLSTLDQRFQSILQNLDATEQRLAQMEAEQFMNR